MAQRQVQFEWAWISKEPGSYEDYGVIGASKGLRATGADTRIYAAGVPASSMPGDAPPAPPWLTFGCHHNGPAGRLLSVSVQDPWQGQDQARRPIWPRRFFLCQYEDVCVARASYRTIWQALAPVRLPRPDDQPVPALTGSQPVSDLVGVIDGIGFDNVAATAAALLDDPLAVTGTSGLRLTDPSAPLDRLAVLDAVAALLPYGFRADLSASTAVDNTVAHRMRLILAEYADRGQQAARLRGAPVVPRSGLARAYLSMLLDKGRWDGPHAVVAHLWDATDACSFGQPEAALEILDELNRSGHRIRKANEDAESLASSRAFFRGTPSQVQQVWHSAALAPVTRLKLLRPFLDAAAEPLAEALHPYWDVVADDYVALARQRLDDEDFGPAVRGLQVAESLPDARGAADRALCELVGPRQGQAESGQRGVAARAALLRRRPVPVPGTFGKTRAALISGQLEEWPGQLVRELLFTEIVADSTAARARAWACWLAGPAVDLECADTRAPDATVPDWVAALGHVATGAAADGAAVRSLIQQDPVWAAIVLTLASGSGRIDIPGVADDLAAQAALVAMRPETDETRSVMMSAIRAASREESLDPAVLAAVDAALLLLGERPAIFSRAMTEQAVSYYDACFRRVLQHPSVGGAQPPLTSRLLNCLVRPNPLSILPDQVVLLLRAWSEDVRLVPALASFATLPEATAVLARDRRLTHDFWSRLAAEQPALRYELLASLLRSAVERTISDPATLARYVDEGSGVSGSELALAMYKARLSGVSVAQIIEVIGITSVNDATLIQRISQGQLDDVLDEFAYFLAYPRRGAADDTTAAGRRAEAENALLESRELICAGALGGSYAGEFRRSLTKRLRDEEARRRRLRRRLRRSAWPFGHWGSPLPAPASPRVPGEDE